MKMFLFISMLIIVVIYPVAALSEISVCVSIPPQADIVRNIGKDHVQVQVLITEGQDPHTFEPTPSQLVQLSKVELYFSLGLPFETRLLEKLHSISKNVKIIDTLEGLPVEGHHHHHNHNHEAKHEESDPHVWLSPPLLKGLAENITEALKKADTENSCEYENNYKSYKSKIDQTNQKIMKILSPYQGNSFYVFHAAFGHFAEAYGLKQVPVQFEGKEPGPRQLTHLIRQAQEENIRMIFVQPEFDRKPAETIAGAIGAKTVVMDPLAETILDNLMTMAEKIRNSMERRE